MAFATIKKRVALQAPVSIHFTYDTRSLPTIINCFHITHTKWRVSVERVKALELLFLEEGSNYMLGGFRLLSYSMAFHEIFVVGFDCKAHSAHD